MKTKDTVEETITTTAKIALTLLIGLGDAAKTLLDDERHDDEEAGAFARVWDDSVSRGEVWGLCSPTTTPPPPSDTPAPLLDDDATAATIRDNARIIGEQRLTIRRLVDEFDRTNEDLAAIRAKAKDQVDQIDSLRRELLNEEACTKSAVRAAVIAEKHAAAALEQLGEARRRETAERDAHAELAMLNADLLMERDNARAEVGTLGEHLTSTISHRDALHDLAWKISDPKDHHKLETINDKYSPATMAKKDDTDEEAPRRPDFDVEL